MSIEATLVVRGIRLQPWQRDGNLRKFAHRQFHGLLDLRDGITIIGVFNDHPGSGALGDLMNLFEESADENLTHVRVVHFWSERLRLWFARRGYYMSYQRKFGKYAERSAKILQPVVA